jgi:hypothetical protein
MTTVLSVSPAFVDRVSVEINRVQLLLKNVSTALPCLSRVAILAVVLPFSVVDAMWMRLMTAPTGTALAHMRARWLHRWSRIVRTLLGLPVEYRGHLPVSGIVVANYTSLLDAILLAAARPCVFVACAEVRRRPVLGLLARLAGTVFLAPGNRGDVVRVNFMIQRALQRRLLVVVFPECGGACKVLASEFFQPAVSQPCTLTAAAVHRNWEHSPVRASKAGRVMESIHSFFNRCTSGAVVSFSGPKFRRGDRKQLAVQLKSELIALREAAAPAV